MYEKHDEPQDYSPFSGWMGCPHCDGPIRVEGVEAEAVKDTALSVLQAFTDGRTKEEIVAALEKVVKDAEDSISLAVRPTAPVKRLIEEPHENDTRQARERRHQEALAQQAKAARPRARR